MKRFGSLSLLILGLATCAEAEQKASAQCVPNTGYPCNNGACDANLGEAICDTSYRSGGCFCKTGYCSGNNAACHNATNAPPEGVSSSQVYAIRNSRWPDYYMYVNSMGMVLAGKGHDEDVSKFTIVEPPYSDAAAPLFFLFSKEWPDSPVFMKTSSSCNGGAHNTDCSDTYAAGCHKIDGTGAGGLESSPSAFDFGLHFEVASTNHPNPGRTLLAITGAIPSEKYFYQSFANQVKGYDGDPGAAGYWYLEPELPASTVAKLRAPSYGECSFNCGEVAKISMYDVNDDGNGTITLSAASRIGMSLGGIALGSALLANTI